jgi:hypothetical protein
MRPSHGELFMLEETQSALLVLEELGRAVRFSLESDIFPLPPNMCLLMLRLAFAEMVRSAADDGLRTDVFTPSNGTVSIIVPEARIRRSRRRSFLRELFYNGCVLRRPLSGASRGSGFSLASKIPSIPAPRPAI